MAAERTGHEPGTGERGRRRPDGGQGAPTPGLASPTPPRTPDTRARRPCPARDTRVLQLDVATAEHLAGALDVTATRRGARVAVAELAEALATLARASEAAGRLSACWDWLTTLELQLRPDVCLAVLGDLGARARRTRPGSRVPPDERTGVLHILTRAAARSAGRARLLGHPQAPVRHTLLVTVERGHGVRPWSPAEVPPEVVGEHLGAETSEDLLDLMVRQLPCPAAHVEAWTAIVEAHGRPHDDAPHRPPGEPDAVAVPFTRGRLRPSRLGRALCDNPHLTQAQYEAVAGAVGLDALGAGADQGRELGRVALRLWARDRAGLDARERAFVRAHVLGSRVLDAAEVWPVLKEELWGADPVAATDFTTEAVVCALARADLSELLGARTTASDLAGLMQRQSRRVRLALLGALGHVRARDADVAAADAPPLEGPSTQRAPGPMPV